MNAALNALAPHRREFLRAVRNRRFEQTERGIYVPSMRTGIDGYFEHTLNHKDARIDPNIIPTEGLNLVLESLFDAIGVPMYVGLFSANVTPLATLTAANWVLNQTEFTGYSGTDRIDYVPGAAASGALDNDSDRAEFAITSSATIYGGALCTAQAKSATTGSLLACAKFATGRAVVNGDTLQVKYSLSVTSG